MSQNVVENSEIMSFRLLASHWRAMVNRFPLCFLEQKKYGTPFNACTIQ